MNREETIARLKEGQKMPHATIADLRRLPDNISEEVLSEYLKGFLSPSGTCWFCEHDLILDWGLVHGVAHCVECGIESRAFHYLKNDKGEEVKLEIGLQYHPSKYEVGEEE